MKTNTKDTSETASAKAEKAEPVLKWRVTKVPPETGYIQAGKVRAYPTAVLNLTKTQADALNSQLPGCVTWLGV